MHLWRIESIENAPTPLTSLAEDLALHVRYAPITTLLMQIGSRQQSYISTLGCPGCAQRRCTVSCHMQLMRRLLVANRAAREIRLVPHGLMPRPYTRLVVAIPGKQAQPLDGTLLQPWRDARLWATWRTLFGKRMVGAALMVGEDGPAPAAVLRTHGWQVFVASKLMTKRLTAQQPAMLPFGWFWQAAPQVLLPRLLTNTTFDVHAAPIVTPPPVTSHTLPDLTQAADVPLTLGGKAVGMLTVALMAEATQNLALALTLPVGAPIPTPIVPSQATPSAKATQGAANQRLRRSWGVPAASAQAVTPASETTPVALPEIIVTSDDISPASSERDTHASAGTGTSSFVAVTANNSDCDHRDVSVQADQPLTPEPQPLIPASWPAGPANLAPSEVENLLTAMLQDARLTTGRSGQIGLAAPRLRNFYGFSMEDAYAILDWFERAGILAEPKNPLQPWAMPRPFGYTDPLEIARALHNTPIPSEREIAATL